jgi:hypothetical protein
LASGTFASRARRLWGAGGNRWGWGRCTAAHAKEKFLSALFFTKNEINNRCGREKIILTN